MEVCSTCRLLRTMKYTHIQGQKLKTANKREQELGCARGWFVALCHSFSTADGSLKSCSSEVYEVYD